MRLDCLASNERLRCYYAERGYRLLGEKTSAGRVPIVLWERDACLRPG